MNKICNNCKIEKPLGEFYTNYNKPKGQCKICEKGRNKQYKNDNKKKLKYIREENKSIKKEYNKQYREENKDKIKEYQKSHNSIPTIKERKKEYNKIYRDIPENKNKKRENEKEKYHSDPEYKLLKCLRIRLLIALKNKSKSANTKKLLGCTIPELMIHLEKYFYPRKGTGEEMTFDKFGYYGIHIDHHRPCASFKNLSESPEQQRECFHYTNLRPLWMEDNLSKSDKIIQD